MYMYIIVIDLQIKRSFFRLVKNGKLHMDYKCISLVHLISLFFRHVFGCYVAEILPIWRENPIKSINHM